jgi:predicted membrane protein DUF2207
MDRRAIADLALAAVSLGLWFLLYAGARLLTRPARPAPSPATMELGPEPPAVVSLLVNRWALTEDAAESTLLDLAARKFFELRQPGGDPLQTTVHVPASEPDASVLRPYERQVLDRVRGLAVRGVVPLSGLTFRDAGQAQAWNKRLRAAVIADARGAGLSRRRFGPAVTTLLLVAAVLAAAGVGLAALHYGLWDPDGTDDNPGLGAGLITFGLLSVLAGRSPGERDTPAGRAVAARWLGVRDWLRGHEQFADLPPASVAVWDRYLGYGAAVGATHLASAVLDLDMGDRRLVWSSHGGTWHRIRVRYPRFWPRYGRTLPILVLRAVAYAAAGGFLFRIFGWPDPGSRIIDRVGAGLSVASLALLLVGVYVLVRGLLDLATERTITGEVLWQEVWRSTNGTENNPSRPWLHYFAIDDGTDDRTTAWGLPSEWSGRCHDGDTVTIRMRPWSRRIGELSVVGQGRSRHLVETVTADDTGNLALRMLTPGAPAPDPFAPAAVGRMLGREVVASPLSVPGLPGVQYRPAEGGSPLLLVQTLQGLPGRVAWRANSRGQQLPGIADGAYASGERAALRHGDTTIVLTLLGDGRTRREHLPWLLAQAAVPAGQVTGDS